MSMPFSKIAESVIKELYNLEAKKYFSLHDLHTALKVNDITSERAIKRNIKLLLELDYLKLTENDRFLFSKRSEPIIDWIKAERQKIKETKKQESITEQLQKGNKMV